MFILQVITLLWTLQTSMTANTANVVHGQSLVQLVYGPGGNQALSKQARPSYFTNRIGDFDDRVFFDSATSKKSLPVAAVTTAVPTTTASPSRTVADEDVSANAIPVGQRAPSRCVWAIVSCCTPQSSRVRHACFETLGCRGPFWDNSPCDGRFTQSAAKTALDFYATG